MDAAFYGAAASAAPRVARAAHDAGEVLSRDAPIPVQPAPKPKRRKRPRPAEERLAPAVAAKVARPQAERQVPVVGALGELAKRALDSGAPALRAQREALPVLAHADAIAHGLATSASGAIVVVGETGSGKTTREAARSQGPRLAGTV